MPPAAERRSAARCRRVRAQAGPGHRLRPGRGVAATSRFVLVDDFEIRGGGIVREALPDRQAAVRDRVLLRNYKWEPSVIQPEQRAEKYNQKAALILVTGEDEAERKGVAKGLEGKLFEDGKVVYFLGIGNVLYGVDADIEPEAGEPAGAHAAAGGGGQPDARCRHHPRSWPRRS